MKFYEKPMAIVEKIEVEDVITASVHAATAAEKEAILGQTTVSADNLVLFQW